MKLSLLLPLLLLLLHHATPARATSCSGASPPARSAPYYVERGGGGTTLSLLGEYNNDLDCEWEFCASGGRTLTVTVDSFRTESCCDGVSVLTAPDGSVVERWFSASRGDTTGEIPEQCVTVRFESDSSVTSEGFSLTIEAEGCPLGSVVVNGTACEPCPAGTAEVGGGCVPCAPGTYAGAGATECFRCVAGQYLAAFGDAVCTPCPSGTRGVLLSDNVTTACEACTATGAWSAPGSVSCGLCPAGSYCPAPGERRPCPPGHWGVDVGVTAANQTCRPCEVGEYAAPGSTKCGVCGNTYRLREDASGCDGICFCLDRLRVAVATGAPALVVLSGLAGGGVRLQTAVMVLFSVGDLLTDAAYVMTETFVSDTFKWLCFGLLFGQLLPFFVLFPPSAAGLCAGAAHMGWWHGNPFEGGVFRRVITGDKVDYNLIFVLVNLVFTLAYYAVWPFANAVVLVYRAVVWPLVYAAAGAVGLLLFATKMLSVPRVADRWQAWWAPADEVEGAPPRGVRLRAFNKMLLSEMVLETVPQIAVQFVNNEGRWSTVAVVSMVFSCMVLASHAWKFAGHVLCDDEVDSVFDVPTLGGRDVIRGETSAPKMELPKIGSRYM